MADRSSGDIPSGELLDRYLSGECSEEEGARVRRYLMANPDAALALERVLGRRAQAAGRPPAPDSAASWASVRHRLRDPGQIAGPPGEPPSSARKSAPRRTPFAARIADSVVPWWRRPSLAAAIVIVIASGGFVAYQQSRL